MNNRISFLKKYLGLYKVAQQFNLNIKFKRAYTAYKMFFKIDIIPGPAGTMGQIFFLPDNPNSILKFTLDSSEAKNMMMVYNIQSDKNIVIDLTPEELDVIKNKIIKIYNVFAFEYDRGKVWVIEQEKGKDLPSALSSKLLSTIGSNVFKQPDDVFTIIQDRLSDENKRKELSEILYNSLIENGEITLKPEDVDVGDLGGLLKAVRNKIDKSFRDFRPSNMLITKNDGKITVKLTDLGYGSGAVVDIPVISM